MRTIEELRKEKFSVREIAKRANKSRTWARNFLKEYDLLTTREEYEKTATKRRETAYNLRQSGLKWREVAETMETSIANVQMLAKRYKEKKNEIRS